ncbi:regulator [Vibrio scophthalmi]|uniref:regulator n=1 Tax=Vibrio scophthalmi TaxID=45658 RepID=UPI002283EA50|nr:regulator [Vibrio scophthalmi]MCY9803343.1 regulator [Vibrio scophthalmi]
MKYHEMTKNYIFRELKCGLSIEQIAELCFKSVRTITEWDKGKPIPKECKRLMKLSSGRKLSNCKEWQQFVMYKDKLELPTGQRVGAQEVLAGIALLSINSELELKTTSKLLKFARAISKIKTS